MEDEILCPPPGVIAGCNTLCPHGDGFDDNNTWGGGKVI